MGKLLKGVNNGLKRLQGKDPNKPNKYQQMKAEEGPKAEAAQAESANLLKQKMAERPGYKGINNPDGTQNRTFVNENQKSQIGELDKRLGNVKDVSVTKTVGPGSDFTAAQGDMASLRARAFGTGPSAQAQAQMKLADSKNAESRDMLNKDSARQQQSSVNAMAQQGGISSGSRERMAMNAQRQKIMGSQGLSRQGEQTHMQISAQDEAQRSQLQQQMPGMGVQMDAYNTGLQNQDRNVDMQQQQFNAGLGMQKTNAWSGMMDAEQNRKQQNDQYNTTNQIQDNQSMNNWNMDGWQTDMAATGAGQAADVQQQMANKEKNKKYFGIF